MTVRPSSLAMRLPAFAVGAFAMCTVRSGSPDDRTIQFRLKRPFPNLPVALGKSSSPICPIMPERLANTDPTKAITEMVGSGPFRFLADERMSGAHVAYARFDGY